MIRKFIVVAAAIAAFGTASLAVSNPVFAGGKGGGGGGHHHGHFRGGLGIGLGFTTVEDSCYRQVWHVNRRGEPVLRTIYICD